MDHTYLSPELGARVVRDAQTLNNALGYEMNTIEFAVEPGEVVGFPGEGTAPCGGEGCPGPLTGPPAPPGPASAGFTGPGNPPAPKHHKKKHHKKKHHKKKGH